MFSGIVETQVRVLSFLPTNESVYRLQVQKPESCEGLKIGDSLSLNGVCLTLVDQAADALGFDVGPETLSIAAWGPDLVSKKMNFESSLRFGDRVHGHFVTGHVDTTASILAIQDSPEWRIMKIEIPKELQRMVWKKGSIAVNGVSLTVNQADANSFEVGLIPETLRRTNLKDLQVGDLVLLEADNMARGLIRAQEVSL